MPNFLPDHCSSIRGLYIVTDSPLAGTNDASLFDKENKNYPVLTWFCFVDATGQKKETENKAKAVIKNKTR